jgi:hypothetical protein
VTDPVEPELLVPEKNNRLPLMPAVPPFFDVIRKKPLDLPLELPDLILITPPVFAFPEPAANDIGAPIDPVVVIPLAIKRLPLLSVLLPVLKCISPEDPAELLPVENNNDPETPVLPEFSLCKFMLPEDLVVPIPV